MLKKTVPTTSHTVSAGRLSSARTGAVNGRGGCVPRTLTAYEAAIGGSLTSPTVDSRYRFRTHTLLSWLHGVSSCQSHLEPAPTGDGDAASREAHVHSYAHYRANHNEQVEALSGSKTMLPS